ncbi:MAG: DUF3592 domain-containing protein [candidate division Zixibacteria bacterium]|nr:DUF3592 domain-containing protein [candidate division Zixibacteria bacterium]
MTSLNLIVISFAVTFLFAALGLLFGRKAKTPSRLKVLLICGLIVAGAGLWLIFYSADDLSSQIAKFDWPSAGGVVVSSTVIDEKAIYPQIIYRYEIDSQGFVDTSDFDAPGFGGKSVRRQTARELTRRFPAGELVNVYYDPSNPNESVLKRGLRWGVVFKFGFGMMLLCAAGFLLGFYTLRPTGGPDQRPPPKDSNH